MAGVASSKVSDKCFCFESSCPDIFENALDCLISNLAVLEVARWQL